MYGERCGCKDTDRFRNDGTFIRNLNVRDSALKNMQ